MDVADAVGPGADGVEVVGGDRAERRGGAVGQDDVDRADVVDGLAVAERPGAGRVVADHPAERRPVARRDVGAEHQAERLEVGVELVEHDPRLDPDGHRGRDRRRRSGSGTWRSRSRSAGPTVCPERLVAAPRGRIGTPSSAAIRTAATTSSTVLRHDDAQRLDLVEAGVGGVEPRDARGRSGPRRGSRGSVGLAVAADWWSSSSQHLMPGMTSKAIPPSSLFDSSAPE